MLIDYFRYLTLKKIINSFKGAVSYGLSLLLKKPVVFNYPVVLTIEPTNVCNLRCPQCPSGAGILTREKGFLKLENFKKTIDELRQFVIEILLYFQGEPLLNNEIYSMIDYAKKAGIYTTVNTNGNFDKPDETAVALVESGLEKIIISLDGVTEKTYNEYRKNGDFNKVITGIREIVKRKKSTGRTKPRVILQFLVMKHNEHEIDDFKKLSGNLGCDGYSIKTVQIYEGLSNKEFLPSKEKYSRYRKNVIGMKARSSIKNRCKRVWFTIVITWDGRFVPCCFDKDADYSFGNVFGDGSSLVLWKSQRIQAFRKMIVRNQSEIAICNNCIETAPRSHIIARR